MSWAIVLQVLGVLKGIKWYWIVIVVLLAIILIQRGCMKPDTIVEERVVHSVDTVIEITPKPYPVEVYKPYPVYEVKDSLVFVPADVDTAFILKDYFRHNFYKDTILDDSNGFIVISDVLYQNSIESRSKSITMYDRTVYIHIVDERKPVNKIFAGLNLGYGFKYDRPIFGADVLLVTKKDNAYSLGYDVFNNAVSGTMYWKIRLRKRN